MATKGIKGVLGFPSREPLDTIQKKVFFGCAVKVFGITPVKYEDREVCIISFEIRDSRFFPSLLENFRENEKQYKLTMNVFVEGKKVNLGALK